MCAHLGEWLGKGLLLTAGLYFAAFLYLHYVLKIEHKDTSVSLGGDAFFGFLSPSYLSRLFRFIINKRYFDLDSERLHKLCEGIRHIALIFFFGLIAGFIFLQTCATFL